MKLILKRKKKSLFELSMIKSRKEFLLKVQKKIINKNLNSHNNTVKTLLQMSKITLLLTKAKIIIISVLNSKILKKKMKINQILYKMNKINNQMLIKIFTIKIKMIKLIMKIMYNIIQRIKIKFNRNNNYKMIHSFMY